MERYRYGKTSEVNALPRRLIHFTETQTDFNNDVLTFPYSETRPTGIAVSN